MDPLEYLFRQRQQRYDIIDNITDRLAKIGEDRRRKMFTQAAMSAIPDDAPVTYDVYTNLINEFPSVDPQEAFQIVGGLAKIKTADRVKRVVRALQESKYDSDIERKATAETLYRNNADIWGDVAEILKHGQAQYVERNPERDRYKIDPVTGGETLVGRATPKEDANVPQWRARVNQLTADAGGDTRKALEWYQIEQNFPVGKVIKKKQRDESGEVREIQKTVTGYDPKTHAPVFDETDITEDYLQKKQYRDYVASQRARGVAEKDIPAFDEFLIMMKSVTDRIMMGGYGGGGGSAPSAPSPTTKTWNPTKGAFE